MPWPARTDYSGDVILDLWKSFRHTRPGMGNLRVTKIWTFGGADLLVTLKRGAIITLLSIPDDHAFIEFGDAGVFFKATVSAADLQANTEGT